MTLCLAFQSSADKLREHYRSQRTWRLPQLRLSIDNLKCHSLFRHKLIYIENNMNN